MIKKENSENIANYITVFEKILDVDFCDELIAEFEASDEWKFAKVGMRAEVDKNIRNLDAIALSDSKVIQRNFKVRDKIEKTLFRAAGEAIRQYQGIFPFCRVVEGMGFELLRYNVGGFYRLHTDSFKRVPRELTFTFTLNEDFEGGEWSFFCGRKILKPPKGSVVAFPSNFMFPHEIMPITKGTRYSIVTWMI